MVQLMLNVRKSNNYAFFCPVSRLHLTVSSPVGFSSEVTPAILRALKSGVILDVDNVIDIKTGKLIEKTTKTTIVTSNKTEEESSEELATTEEPTITEESEEEKTVKNKRKNKNNE